LLIQWTPFDGRDNDPDFTKARMTGKLFSVQPEHAEGPPHPTLNRDSTPVQGGSPAVPRIKVAIVEDEPEVRRRFEDAVNVDARLAHWFSAADAGQAIALTVERPADVYLVDLGLPDRDGREFIRWLVTRQPDALSMVVTVFGDESHVVSSLEAGAMGYLLKDTPIHEIAQRIVELHEGGSPISPSVARSLIKRLSVRPAEAARRIDNPLSERELEVLRLIEKGLTYDEVSSILGVTWNTVTSHLRRVYRKLQVGSRSEAVYEARQRGIL
jgi:DNA-binding NarL/FixJ family response regulator